MIFVFDDLILVYVFWVYYFMGIYERKIGCKSEVIEVVKCLEFVVIN